MGESNKSVRVVGDYLVGKQIGSGSFSVVWHGKHRVNHTEVAIKEIVTGRLTKKLEESLLSEIRILRHIVHPNIIHLYDMIQEPGKIYFVLEFCKGGDLSMFLHKRKGRITESTAKHFMLQLASGLKILRDNDLIHRDLKPQNLLLSTNGEDSVLKIADFGFARSLQPRNLAETLCGSPLYMAPEIMQVQKYDAKADLWSVGAILFQLVTGKTPFTGNNQIQLLQNIMRSTELAFPPNTVGLSSECIDLCRKLLRPNPVERLTFEEFFNHPFLSQNLPDKTSRSLRSLGKGVFPINKANPDLRTNKNSQEDHLPSSLDNKSSGPDKSSTPINRSPLKSTYGFSVNTRAEKKDVHKFSSNMDMYQKSSSGRHKPELLAFNLNNSNPSEGNVEKSLKSVDHQTVIAPSTVLDSFELIAQEYVMVSNPPLDMSSSDCASELNHLPSKVEYPLSSGNITNLKPIAPVKLTAATTKESCNGCSENHGLAPSGTSLGSFRISESPEQPSMDSVSRIKSLQNCASTITQLVNEKVESGKHLEAFSVQLVILAIWKQTLNICHTQAASATEGSPTQETMRELANKEHLNPASWQHPQDVYSQIERAFLLEVGNAEELAKLIEPGNQEMPDAMETIFQSALDLGRHGAVHEFNGNKEDAAEFYSKASCLLNFLLLEGPSLIINHPFSLTNSDRYRLQTYIDVLNNRQNHSRSQRMVLLDFEDQQSPP
ncbi:serine/threonine-protein kinase ATG1c [Heracleum sosnowskyi]|uniref:Serine/threonine-protein kinase ATG1c n=1 Tax=Heracleum sosnowskyi TaxID=360622 RepID=A0AAD8GUD7_9APIA|nr:serine/threonine-protein kinase ATG1c [Heracleum sosnowskyi]